MFAIFELPVHVISFYKYKCVLVCAILSLEYEIHNQRQISNLVSVSKLRRFILSRQ